MNCQDIAHILNDRSLTKLTTAERDQINSHLADCTDCASDWALHERIASCFVPAMPTFLARWRPAPVIRRKGSAFVIPVLLLAGAAAALVMWQLSQQVDTADAQSLLQDPGPATARTETPTPDLAPRPESPIGTAPETVKPAIPPGSGQSPLAVLIVLPTQYGNSSAAAIAAVDEMKRWMMRELQAVPGLSIVQLTTADVAFVDQDASESEQTAAIFDRFGSDVIARLAVPSLENPDPAGEPYTWGTTFAVHRLPSGTSTRSRTSGGDPEPGELERDGMEAARMVINSLTSEIVQPYLETVFLDSGRTEAERLEAIRNLARGLAVPMLPPAGAPNPGSPGLSRRVIDAAVELARSASNPDTREEIWYVLGATGDAELVQPLLDALLYDSDADVRRASASILEDHRGNLVVVTALQAAATDDPSATVRAMATWSLLTEQERPAYVNDTLRNARLLPEEKVAVLRLTRGFPSPYRRQAMVATVSRQGDFPIDDEALDALVSLAESGNRSDIRQAVLRELGLRAHPAFFELMSAETDADVRRAVIFGLGSRVQQDTAIAQIMGRLLEVEPDPGIRSEIESRLSSRPEDLLLLRLREGQQ